MSDHEKYDDRLDRLVNLDIGNRGIEPLYQAARALVGGPLVGAAADRLLAIPQGGTVLVTTGSVSRAWLSAELGENDGPSGAAAIAGNLRARDRGNSDIAHGCRASSGRNGGGRLRHDAPGQR